MATPTQLNKNVGRLMSTLSIECLYIEFCFVVQHQDRREKEKERETWKSRNFFIRFVCLGLRQKKDRNARMQSFDGQRAEFRGSRDLLTPQVPREKPQNAGFF